MALDPRPSPERTFKVYAIEGEFDVIAMSPSVDDMGYLAFYRREEGSTGFLPVAGFPKGSWSAWIAVDEPD